MRCISFFILYLLLKLCLNAQSSANQSTQLLYGDLIESLDLGLNYLEATQRRETIEGQSYRGEWPTQMCLQKSFLFLGPKRVVDDSNCFSVASIHNALANIYLDYPEYEAIPQMLDLSFSKIMSYRNGDKFNFWNLLPPNIKLKKDDVIGEQSLVRRPTQYYLKSVYINNAANVVEDADDTSLAYTAVALRRKYRGKLQDSFCLNLDSIAPVFEQFIDVERNNYHWYNYLYGNDHNTGAYLTWLAPEYQFKSWSILKVIGHNATFYLPFSECNPKSYVPYLPYGSNDLDGVVNSNVLTALSQFDELDSESVDATIRFIEKKSLRGKYEHVGIYYPNRYQFPFAVSNAYANGVHGLKESANYISNYLVENQNTDGSWNARKRLNKGDRLQSTVYALNGLINIGNFNSQKTTQAIELAINYLLDQSIVDDQGIHWDGGVFFSGGTIVRNALVWKSDSYTTVLILNAFANYRKHLEREYSFSLRSK